MTRFEQNCNNRKMAAIGPKHVVIFLLLNTIINPYNRSCVFMTDIYLTINPFTPNIYYSGRTAPLTSKRCILYIYSTNIGTEYFKHGI